MSSAVWSTHFFLLLRFALVLSLTVLGIAIYVTRQDGSFSLLEDSKDWRVAFALLLVVMGAPIYAGYSLLSSVLVGKLASNDHGVSRIHTWLSGILCAVFLSCFLLQVSWPILEIGGLIMGAWFLFLLLR